jgi:tetratricopeptide (TPR) repeat protein
VIEAILQVLQQFVKRIFQNAHLFKESDLGRAIDAMHNSALALICRRRTNNVGDDLADAVSIVRNSVSRCATHVPESMRTSASTIFNLAAYTFKSRLYERALELFDIVIEISIQTGDQTLCAKSHKLRAQSLLALDRHDSAEFFESLEYASDLPSLLYSWVALHPPKIPTTLAKLLRRVPNCDMFAPYFALIGDFASLAKFPAFAKFFPDLKMPERISLVDDQSLMMHCPLFPIV